MEEDRKNYYRLAELFDTIVRPALSELLQKAMDDKLRDDYQHTTGWWKENHGKCLTRLPPTGIESVVVCDTNPSDWPMNLLLKVIKYSNYDLFERNGTVWHALNVLIDIRNELLADYKESQRVPTNEMKGCFRKIEDAISKFNLSNNRKIIADQKALQTIVHSEDDWKEYHTKLLEGGASWKEFGETFYERDGTPTLSQLHAFSGKDGRKFSVIQRIATKYSEIGTFLLDDRDGTIVAGIRQSMSYQVTAISEEIFRMWLTGNGRTWSRLVSCIRDAGLNALARDIQECLI